MNVDRQDLKVLNETIALMEQHREAEAKAWFGKVLSDKLVFRRANGTVVDKQAFLKNLNEPNPFTARTAEDMNITVLDDRALVTLVVRTTKADETENRYRNIRLFSKQPQGWTFELWYNYDLTSL